MFARKKNIILQGLSYLALGLLGLIVLALLSLTMMIAEDLPRADMIEKYRTPNSFFYPLPSGAVAHITDSGGQDKPALLLIHGSNASLHTWLPWHQHLAAHYRLIAFDLPGHGLTGATPQDDYSIQAMAVFTREVAALFKLQRYSLAGNSMGGAVALQVALDAPQAVDALVLVSSSGMRRNADDESVGAFKLANSALGRMAMRYVTPRFTLAGTLRGVVADPDNFVTDEMVDRYWELLRMTGSRDATIKRFAGPRRPLEPRLGELDVPTLILWGQQDPLIKVEYGIAMNAAIVGSFLRLYPQASHLAHEEIPMQTARDTHMFLADIVQ